MAPAEPGAPPPAAHPARRAPPRGPGAPGAGRDPILSLQLGLDCCGLALQGRPQPPAPSQALRCQLGDSFGGAEVELFGCWEAELLCFRNGGTVAASSPRAAEGPLERPQPALRQRMGAGGPDPAAGGPRACSLGAPRLPPTAPAGQGSGKRASDCKLPPPTAHPPLAFLQRLLGNHDAPG